jgi:hypothetical protein
MALSFLRRRTTEILGQGLAAIIDRTRNALEAKGFQDTPESVGLHDIPVSVEFIVFLRS